MEGYYRDMLSRAKEKTDVDAKDEKIEGLIADVELRDDRIEELEGILSTREHKHMIKLVMSRVIEVAYKEGQKSQNPWEDSKAYSKIEKEFCND